MRCEVVAVGTELLLGYVVDTNSSWIGEQLMQAGIDSHFQTKVGDNLDRVVSVIRLALERSDAVIVCGGLGPTADDLTRAAIAAVMGVELERREELIDDIRARFAARSRAMPANNLRQADVPVGGEAIPNPHGTAPGLRCEVGDKVIYAVPGVPSEMREMILASVLPDLQERAGVAAVILSRTLRTWGESESGLDERLTGRMAHLDSTGAATLAFLASGIEGIKVRLIVKAPTAEEATATLDTEEAEVRAVLGDLVFGVDEESMEHAVVRLLADQGLTIAVAESATGGMIASRLTDVPGSGDVFLGGVVSYASEVKYDLLGVPEGPVVTGEAAMAMAEGVRRLLHADVGLAVTGVAGPTEQEGVPVGTVWVGLAVDDDVSDALFRFGGARTFVRQIGTISALDRLRRRLLERAAKLAHTDVTERPGAAPGGVVAGRRRRLFVALWPPSDVLDDLEALPRPAVPGVRWTVRDQWHVTLRFLGTADEAEVAAALAGLSHPPVPVAIGPRAERLAGGLVLPVSGAATLAAAVGEATARLGEPLARRFRGHLTVARGRAAAAHQLAPLATPLTWTAREVALVASSLEADRARYRTVATVPLG